MASSSPLLVVRHGPNPNQEYPLVLSSNIIGREPINDVVFPDPEVSRRHARIVSQNNNYYIEDLGSTNGTFVNGRRISIVTRLSNGDIIDLGESIRLTFVLEQQTEEPATSAAAMEPNGSATGRSYPVAAQAAATRDRPDDATPYETAESSPNLNIIYGIGALLVIIIIIGLIFFFSGNLTGG